MNPAVLGSVPFRLPRQAYRQFPSRLKNAENALSMLLVLLITYRRHCLVRFDTLEIRLVQEMRAMSPGRGNRNTRLRVRPIRSNASKRCR